jgi:GNAT superfamily N-acetyltransferase
VPRLRPLEWPRDEASLAGFDLAVTTGTVHAVVQAGLGTLALALEERAVDPPLVKRYAVDWSELPSASHVRVAEVEREAVGVAALAWREWNRRAELTHLYVDAGARGRGVGAALLADARAAAREWGARCLWVETQQVNAPAVRFYRRHGFAWCGADLTLYDPREAPGEVALFFALPLD